MRKLRLRQSPMLFRRNEEICEGRRWTTWAHHRISVGAPGSAGSDGARRSPPSARGSLSSTSTPGRTAWVQVLYAGYDGRCTTLAQVQGGLQP